jgi:alkylhydroperoxidase/carboxymuconolactone decarboxylase family protein YurZ
MDPAEDLLRRVALNDENVLGNVMTQRVGTGSGTELDARIELLVRLGALLALEAAAPSLREVVEKATAAGVTTKELVGVLVCVGPTIGVASMVASASKLATVIGYDLEEGHDPDPSDATSAHE